MKRHHVSVLVKLIIIKKHDVLMNIEAFALTVLLAGNTNEHVVFGKFN